MKTIIEFEYDNINYGVLQDGNKFKYCYFLGNEPHFDLSNNQVMLINKVVNKLTPSKELIKTMEYTINSHKYDVYFDKKTHLHVFSPTPNDEDLGTLNLIFNDMDEYVYEKIEYNKRLPKYQKPSKFKRIVDIGVQLVAAVAISLDLTVLGNLIPKAIDESYGYEITQNAIAYTSSLTDEEYLNRINNAINRNNNLDEHEKSLYLDNTFVYLDNKDYTDIKHLEKVLSNVDIFYNENSCIRNTSNFRISGAYNYNINMIKLYDVSDSNSIDNSTVTHEKSHSLTKYTIAKTFSWLDESTNTIFNDEYESGGMVGNYDTSYQYIVDYAKALMEIIGPTPLQKYHGFTNASPIIESLTEIIDNEDMAYKLLANIEEYKDITENISSNTMTEEEKQTLFSLEGAIYQALDEYYYAKKGINIQDDLVMTYYLDRSSFNKIMHNRAIRQIPHHVFEDSQKKTVKLESLNETVYFNSELKKQEKGITSNVNISLLSSDGMQNNYEVTLEVNNDNRYTLHIIKEIENIMTSEYNGLFSSDRFIKDYGYIGYLKALMEIIGVEPLKTSEENATLTPIIEALCEITGDYEQANSLLTLIDKRNRTDEEEDDLYDKLNAYYYAKNGFSMDNDLVMLYYLKISSLGEYAIESMDLDAKEVLIHPVKQKSYFLYDSQNPSKEIMFQVRKYAPNDPSQDDILLAEMTITDDNRYINDTQKNVR